jgi:conjugative relaxase-like TrwC/TraI family protein
MLSIRPIGSSSEQISYYAGLGEAENHDYYASERQGQWWGSGAAELGLAGEVSSETFGNLLKGYSPDGKKPLVQNAGQSRRRSAFDLTWSVPKSVSVLWSQSNPEQQAEIERRSERALSKALATLDEFCGATRRGHDGEIQERAKLVAAIFRHDTSRAMPDEVPDPNLHFHVVLANISIREDGTTGALDARPLFRKNMKMALGALFRAELSNELQAMGLKTHRPVREGKKNELASWFELTAIPKALLEAMSKRRGAIEKWLAKRGLSGAKAAEQAALSTRQVKKHFTWGELRNAWDALGQTFGFTGKEAQAAIQSRSIESFDPILEAKEAAQRALKRITDDRATFSELDLLRFTAEEAQTRGAGIDQVRQEVSRLLSQSPEIVRLRDQRGEGRFTTQAMLMAEKQMLDEAAGLALSSRHTLNYGELGEVIGSYPTLREEQRAAIRHITVGSDLACINGIAGSGKTYMLSVAREAWEQSGRRVLGTALAAKAAKELEKGSGIESKHIHKLLNDIERGRLRLDTNTVLVVDEAGMVGTYLMQKLTALANESRSKLVLVGDHRQLQAVSAGAPFRVIGERIGNVELEEIIRQREAWAREAVYDFRGGRAAQALQQFIERDLFYLGEDRDDAMQRLVSDWQKKATDSQSMKANLIVAGTNLEVRELNRLCQAARELKGESINLAGLDFHVGDRVLATRNHNPLLIQNGMLGTVSGVDTSTSTLRIRFDDGFQVSIDTRQFSELTLGYAISTHKAQGVTSENTFVLLGEMNDRELSYVQSSRARGETRLYADVLTGGEEIHDIAEQLSQSHPKDLAHEHLREVA